MFIFDWLSIKAKILRNSFRENKKEFLLGDMWHSLIILSGLALLYVFLTAMFHFMDKKELSTFDFAFLTLSFSLLIFMPLVFYSAIVCCLSILFQKEEIHFYFSLPVNRLSVFTVKFLQAYFHTAWMVFLGFITFLAAIQNYFRTPLLIYLTGSISFLVFLLIPISLAAILVILISRFIPFVRAKGMLTLIGLLVGSVLVTIIRVMQPERLITAEGKMRLVTFIQALHKPWMTVFPSEWVTNILFAQTQGDLKGVSINFLSLLALASLLLGLLYFLAGCFYKKIWSDSAVMAPAVQKKFGWQAVLSIFPSSLRGFIKKDLLGFYRDTVEKGSLLILIPLSFVYLYSIYLLNRYVKDSQLGEIFSFLYIYLFNFFYCSIVIAGLSGRWVFPSVSLEGNNFRLIRGSPVPLKDFLKAKFLLGITPLLLLGEGLALISSFILRLSFPFALVSVVTVGILCWGITSLCLILGMKLADFSITAPLDFALSSRGFLCLIWEFIFVACIIVLAGVPIALFLYKGFSLPFIFSTLLSLSITFISLMKIHRTYKTSIVRLSRREV